MAAATLPAPGTRLGPCTGDCAHKDCACTRAMAGSKCRHCFEPIGFDAAFLNPQGPPPLDEQGDPAAWAGRLAHEACELAAIERRRKPPADAPPTPAQAVDNLHALAANLAGEAAAKWPHDDERVRRVLNDAAISILHNLAGLELSPGGPAACVDRTLLAEAAGTITDALGSLALSEFKRLTRRQLGDRVQQVLDLVPRVAAHLRATSGMTLEAKTIEAAATEALEIEAALGPAPGVEFPAKRLHGNRRIAWAFAFLKLAELLGRPATDEEELALHARLVDLRRSRSTN